MNDKKLITQSAIAPSKVGANLALIWATNDRIIHISVISIMYHLCIEVANYVLVETINQSMYSIQLR